MPNGHSGNIQPNLDLEEHDHANQARRVKLADSDLTTLTPLGDGHNVKLKDQNGDPLDAEYGGIDGLKVHVVGDGDKYIKTNIAEGATIDVDDAIPLAGEDASGYKQNLQVNADKDLKVTLDSETVTTISSRPATSAVSQVASSASNVTLKASNANRLGLTIYNDSATALYVKFGATASTASFTIKMAAGSYFEVPSPVYTGIIDGIWASADGNAYITELTA